MSTERRLSPEFSVYELRGARIWKARATHLCYWGDCHNEIQRGDTYARISETRLPVCGAHFTEADIVTITKERKP